MKFNVGDRVISNSSKAWSFAGTVVAIRDSRVAPYKVETSTGMEYHSGRDMDLLEKSKKQVNKVTVLRNQVMIIGRSPSNSYGIWGIKRYRRIFHIEPTLRSRHLTKNELLKVWKSV